MLFLFHSNVALLIPPWNSDFKRLFGLWNSFQSSFANTNFKEAIGVAQLDGERSQSLIAGGTKFLPVYFGEVPFRVPMVFRVVFELTFVRTTELSLPKNSLVTVHVQREAHELSCHSCHFLKIKMEREFHCSIEKPIVN